MAKRIVLADDGTLDTVLRCSECGEEFRGTFDSSFSDAGLDRTTYQTYTEWVADFIADVDEEHDCRAE